MLARYYGEAADNVLNQSWVLQPSGVADWAAQQAAGDVKDLGGHEGMGDAGLWKATAAALRSGAKRKGRGLQEEGSAAEGRGPRRDAYVARSNPAPCVATLRHLGMSLQVRCRARPSRREDGARSGMLCYAMPLLCYARWCAPRARAIVRGHHPPRASTCAPAARAGVAEPFLIWQVWREPFVIAAMGSSVAAGHDNCALDT
jgi:hypothetical protein